MRNLLPAEFVRLRKSLAYRLCLVFSAGLSALIMLIRWHDLRVYAGEPDYEELVQVYSDLDETLFVCSLYLVFVFAAFIGLFVGTEYSDGTMRNKLAAGHTRKDIYLTEWIVCTAGNIIMLVSNMLTMIVLALVLIPGAGVDVKRTLLLAGITMAAVGALTAFLLLFSMLIQSKAAGAVVCMGLCIALIFGAMTITSKLSEPEFYESYKMLDTETMEFITVEGGEPNPNYVGGTKRVIYETVNDLSPVGQIFQIAATDDINKGRMVLFDCLVILLTTLGGILVFRRKDLK